MIRLFISELRLFGTFYDLKVVQGFKPALKLQYNYVMFEILALSSLQISLFYIT